jgi:hypothetical protein
MYYTIELLVEVGSDLVLVLDVLADYRELLLWAPDHKVSIIAHGNPTLASLQALENKKFEMACVIL